MTASKPSFSEGAWDGYPIHNFTKDSLEWLLRKEGLDPERWGVSGRFAKARSRWPAFLGSDLVVLCRPIEPVDATPDFF